MTLSGIGSVLLGAVMAVHCRCCQVAVRHWQCTVETVYLLLAAVRHWQCTVGTVYLLLAAVGHWRCTVGCCYGKQCTVAVMANCTVAVTANCTDAVTANGAQLLWQDKVGMTLMV